MAARFPEEQALSLFLNALDVGIIIDQHGNEAIMTMRPLSDPAGKILPVPPLSKEGTQKPLLGKPVLSFVEGGAVRSAAGFC